MNNQTITAIPGIIAAHVTDVKAMTGCTAILCPHGFTPGFFVPGFAPGTRETELLHPECTVDSIHGIVLSGGSAFGLSAASGVTRFLAERGHGYAMPHGVVPIVSSAVIYDLDENKKPGTLPDEVMGYAAASTASAAPLESGRVGAGTAARCGRLFDTQETRLSNPAGLGVSLLTWRGIQVSAVVVMNPLGNVHHCKTGEFIAGAVKPDGGMFNREEVFRALAGKQISPSNTVLTVVATNVPLGKLQATRFARMAAAGLPRCVHPAHLLYDGDVVFALAAKEQLPAGVGTWTESLLGSMAAEAVMDAAMCSVASRV